MKKVRLLTGQGLNLNSLALSSSTIGTPSSCSELFPEIVPFNLLIPDLVIDTRGAVILRKLRLDLVLLFLNKEPRFTSSPSRLFSSSLSRYLASLCIISSLDSSLSDTKDILILLSILQPAPFLGYSSFFRKLPLKAALVITFFQERRNKCSGLDFFLQKCLISSLSSDFFNSINFLCDGINQGGYNTYVLSNSTCYVVLNLCNSGECILCFNLFIDSSFRSIIRSVDVRNISSLSLLFDTLYCLQLCLSDSYALCLILIDYLFC